MCRKSTGLIWLLIHYYYCGDAPPPWAHGRADARTDIVLGAPAHYFQNASASMAFAFHGAAMSTAGEGPFFPVNFMR